MGEQTGTPVLLADASGIVRENNRVFPFGEPWSQPVASENSGKFTSYERDEASGEAGLDYAMARHYASRSGRFMKPDPGHVGADPNDPQSWNAYVYSRNDPINLIDPSGMSWLAGFCDYDLDTGQYSFECPGYGDPVGESSWHWEMLLAWTYSMMAQEAGQGNRGQPNNLTVQQRLDLAYPIAMRALESGACRSVFNTGRVRLDDPQNMLVNMFFWDGGPVRYNDLDLLSRGPNAQIGPTSMYRYTPGIGRQFAGLDAGSVTITFNNNRMSSFMTGTAQDNAVTILHELGHAYNLLGGRSALREPDNPLLPNGQINLQGNANQRWNDDLIRGSCLPQR